jgi:clan AA aspartic protease (TIGR02281 family)
MRRASAFALAAAQLALAAELARAEIYSWTDAEGRTHYTQDLQSVPSDQRAGARQRAGEDGGPSRLQGFESAPAAVAPRRARAHRASAPSPGRTHYIKLERAGNGMVVPVRINGRVVAPFLVDTGASYVLLPEAVADEAGLTVGPDTRKMQFSTANGVVEQAVVMLDSVELGSASAEQVPASISPSLPIGLLGLSFFNRFTYQVDAANGVLTLVENDLAASGELRGGRSESQWRGEFEAMRQRMAAVEAQRDAAPSTHGRLVTQLEEAQELLERELDQLENEADEAHVPDAWRQ